MTEKRTGILGIGKMLGSKIVTNQDMEKIVETSDEWIRTRTGIIERRLLDTDNGETAVTIGTAAAKEAIKNAGIKPEDIGLIIVSTITPHQPLPATASFIQRELGITNAAAFDISVACPGFVYAVTIADPMIRTGMFKYVLVISVDILSAITNWDDRGTCVLFADGAGAAVLGQVDHPRGVLATTIYNDPELIELLDIPEGGSTNPPTQEIIDNKLNKVRMRGNELFKFAVRYMVNVSKEVLEKANLTVDDIAFAVPHQANIRITDAVAKSLNVPEEKAVSNISHMGNNSSATIPCTLYDLWAQGKLKEGDLVLTPSFGSGISYGALLFRW